MNLVLALALSFALIGLSKTDGSPKNERLLTITSNGESSRKYPELMGVYAISDETLHGLPVYKQKYGLGEIWVDKNGFWYVGTNLATSGVKMYSKNLAMQYPPPDQWQYWDGKWVSDPRLAVIPSSESTCQDTHYYCENWAKEGYCRGSSDYTFKFFDYMTKTCQKSCGICGDFPDYLLDQQSCAIVSTIPPHIADRYRLDPDFYGKQINETNDGIITTYTGKYTEAYGFPITSSKDVDDRALMRLCYTVRYLYASHKKIRKSTHEKGGRCVVIGRNERPGEIPAFSTLNGWDPDTRGMVLGLHVALVGEENLLDYFYKQDDVEMDVAIHEIAHQFHLTGTQYGMPNLYNDIDKAYQSANASGKYVLNGNDMYARKNFYEYFAEGVTSYIGDSWNTAPPHNAKELEEYDKTLYDIMKRAFPCNGPENFIYKHNDIDQVLSRQSRIRINYPNCEEEPSNNMPTEGDIELKTQEEGAIYTWGRQRCILNYTYQGKEYVGCILEIGGTAWCPTHTENGEFFHSSGSEDLHIGSWGYCNKNEEITPKPCHMTTSKKPCLFPFFYLGLEHQSCQGTGWCATKVDESNNMMEWSTCDSKCFSRLENEDPVMTLDNMSKG